MPHGLGSINWNSQDLQDINWNSINWNSINWNSLAGAHQVMQAEAAPLYQNSVAAGLPSEVARDLVYAYYVARMSPGEINWNSINWNSQDRPNPEINWNS